MRVHTDTHTVSSVERAHGIGSGEEGKAYLPLSSAEKTHLPTVGI